MTRRGAVSPLMQEAARRWALLREDYELYKQGMEEAAETACNGCTVRQEGWALGLSTGSLLFGSGSRARRAKYGTRELHDWYAETRPLTLSQFEEAHLDVYLPPILA